MKLYEYEAKQVYAKYNIPIPQGILVTSIEQAKEEASKLKPPYAVKAQVLTGSRGKAGGILFANSTQEAQKATAQLLTTKINNIPVHSVLLEEKLAINKELYLGITIDRLNRTYVVLASATGGVEIEEVAANTPQAIVKALVNPRLGIQSFHATAIARKLGYAGVQLAELAQVIIKLYSALIDNDAELVEINPLAETENGKFVALDARMTIDDNALFRHPEYKAKTAESEKDLTPQEVSAIKNDLAYVKLDGDIDIIGNGAGLVMATLDMITYFGGKPANFLDLGGGATIQRIEAALQIVNSDPNTKVLLINILGGITLCDIVAQAIVETAKTTDIKKPVVVRLVGTNEKEGKKILAQAGIQALDSMEEAARQAVNLAKGENA